MRCGFFYGSDASHTRTIEEGVKKRKFSDNWKLGGSLSSIHIDDAASAFVTAVLEDLKGVLHVMDDSPFKVSEFLNGFTERLGAPAPRRIPE